MFLEYTMKVPCKGWLSWRSSWGLLFPNRL